MTTRQKWLKYLDKLVSPVFTAAANDTIIDVLPQVGEDADLAKVRKFAPAKVKEHQNKDVAVMEAVARSLCGIAPFLALDESKITDKAEKEMQAKYRVLCAKSLDNITNPKAKSYCKWFEESKFMEGYQSVVETAYICSAIIKARKQLFDDQPTEVRQNILTAMSLTAKHKPWGANWLLFASVAEACRYMLTGICDCMRIDFAITKHLDWYKGDGVFGDGENYKFDYYNSYVIQPFLEETLRAAHPVCAGWDTSNNYIFTRAFQRYCEIQERSIAPDGSYPIAGRSIAYRMGAFHALAHGAYTQKLDEKYLPYNQARCALDKVLTKHYSAETLFDENGFLTPGLYGKQPGIVDYYSNIGSLYLCSLIFLPLGLDENHKFWSLPDTLTTWEKGWSGGDLQKDVGLEYR